MNAVAIEVVDDDVKLFSASMVEKDSIADVNENDDDGIVPSSDLSDVNRRIWIVTTAGLPWMTGTAVNPLLRALALAKDRPPHYVTLMIPWLISAEERSSLYGKKHVFNEPIDQEKWIRNYCVERCNCSPEVAYDKLRILFWDGKYQESFGSIFPIHDICSTIPRAEADICILEEPEHLNWFRVPLKTRGMKHSSSGSSLGITSDSEEGEQSTRDKSAPVVDPNAEVNVVVPVDGLTIKEEDIELLGWAHKFRHVVGILHTNYADYIRQYGMASMVTAPALNALSSLVVKAYCHRIIRLSETLPPLDPTKEVTSNVHGVRHEFLEPPSPTVAPNVEDPEELEKAEADGTASIKSTSSKPELAPVYFIGKLIWAKGFERVLELEERFKALTGDYFPMDIYGGGKDEKDIQVAFFGRNGLPRGSSSGQESDLSQAAAAKITDEKVAAVFSSNTSLRDQIAVESTNVENDEYVLLAKASLNENTATTSGGSGTVTPPDPTSIRHLLHTPDVDEGIGTNADIKVSCAPEVETFPSEEYTSPIEVLGDLSGKTVSTTVETADATLKLIDSAMKAGFDAIRGGNNKEKKQSGEGATSPKANNAIAFHHIAPAKTRFKWRRNPVPARFLGVQDHIIIRDIPEHKVFLNMSTSEVLCTTSAEALAMGKFVILPRHCSNTFFLQFPNCLSYETWDECLDRLQFALTNEPAPLTESFRHVLSWDGATERLIQASAITNREAQARIDKGLDKADIKAALFHVDAGTKSGWLRKKILT